MNSQVGSSPQPQAAGQSARQAETAAAVTRLRRSPYAIYAWSVLGYNVLVILWGAFVRATGSGAGCGAHWPLCNGEVLPRAPQLETLIEFSHRLTSGVALILVLGLLIGAFRLYPRGDRLRAAAVASACLILIEALIGAGLVLLEYVATNASIARAYWMILHLINTFLLLAALTLTAWWASGGPPLRLRGQGSLTPFLAAACLAMLLLGASGAITALGDTLVLTAGIRPEESAVVADLVALRIYHPLLAFAVGALLLVTALRAYGQRRDQRTRRLAQALVATYVVQLLVGGLNVALRAPVWLQLLHLLITDAIWILLLLLAFVALAAATPSDRLAPTADRQLAIDDATGCGV